jgi:hypothetical protein
MMRQLRDMGFDWAAGLCVVFAACGAEGRRVGFEPLAHD